MSVIDLEIAEEVLERFPGLHVYGCRARGIRAALSSVDTEHHLRTAEAGLNNGGDAARQDAIITQWREVYGHMGVKPSRYRSSIEAIVRRVRKGDHLTGPFKAVELYNAASLRTLAPIGACDIARLPGTSIRLRAAQPELDRFEPLGGESSGFPIVPGLVVYAAGDEVLCWGFNVRDSKAGALRDDSDDVAFFSEAVTTEQQVLSRNALEAICDTLAGAGATCSSIECAGRGANAFRLA